MICRVAFLAQAISYHSILPTVPDSSFEPNIYRSVTKHTSVIYYLRAQLVSAQFTCIAGTIRKVIGGVMLFFLSISCAGIFYFIFYFYFLWLTLCTMFFLSEIVIVNSF